MTERESEELYEELRRKLEGYGSTPHPTCGVPFSASYHPCRRPRPPQLPAQHLARRYPGSGH